MKNQFSRLKRSFFNKPTLEVSKNLIGCYLVRKIEGKYLIGKIVETEAYPGIKDSASKVFKNKRTLETEIQYGLPGIAYVYLIYGKYYMFSIITEPKNNPACVFIRSLEPIEGQEIMLSLRSLVSNQNLKSICSGPGKLTQAFAITKGHSGQDLCSQNSDIFIIKRDKEDLIVGQGKRIGINYANQKDINQYWRYYLKDSKFLSN